MIENSRYIASYIKARAIRKTNVALFWGDFELVLDLGSAIVHQNHVCWNEYRWTEYLFNYYIFSLEINICDSVPITSTVNTEKPLVFISDCVISNDNCDRMIFRFSVWANLQGWVQRKEQKFFAIISLFGEYFYKSNSSVWGHLLLTWLKSMWTYVFFKLESLIFRDMWLSAQNFDLYFISEVYFGLEEVSAFLPMPFLFLGSAQNSWCSNLS